MKVQFLNISPEDAVKTDTIKCYILRGKKLQEYERFNGMSIEGGSKTRLIPVDDNDKEPFFPGLGYVKITDKNTVRIPAYDMEVESFNEYEQTYNVECLFYCLTQKSIWDRDCCVYGAQREFASSRYDIVQYQEVLALWKKMNDMQLKKLLDYGVYRPDHNAYMRNLYAGKFIFHLHHSIMGFSFPVMLDTPEDDNKLVCLFRHLLHNNEDFRAKHPDAYERAKACIDVAESDFPVCMEERMKMLYGEDFATLYKQILNITCNDEKEGRI